MLSKISWGQFALAVAVILLLYYLVVGCSIYGRKIREFLNKRPGQPMIPNGTVETAPVSMQSDIPGDLVMIEQIINELRYEILPKAGAHATKDKLMIVFKNYLASYNRQNLPEIFKTGINQMIAKEASAQCDVYIEPAEIAELW